MKLVKLSPFAIVLFIITTGAIIVKRPKQTETKTEVSESHHYSLKKINRAPIRTKARIASVLR